jgi:heterodisulfide reductase subunit A-like polyferredoxin
MATLREIKKAFFALSQKEQEAMIKEIYGFSKDMKSFLDMRLLGDGEEQYIQQIMKATEPKMRGGYPKEISVREVNAILSKAKKSRVSKKNLCEMEWIAFDGYMTFLNDYGGGPEIYEDKVYDHLNNHLRLLLELGTIEENEEKIEAVAKYLRRHTNMYYDHIWELFEEITGVDI